MRVSYIALIALFISPVSWGGNMVFQFVNPNFGGNPNNGSFLLNEANAQNSYKDPNGYDFDTSTPSPLDNFTSVIQSQLLGNLMGNISQGKPGRLVTKDFIVDVKNTDGRLTMNILDRTTGKSSTIEVDGLSSIKTN
ncbi:MAG: curli production assembly/transport protein CsgF [Enterobacterales bacterium]|uniref:curli production assembly/transport protein CsgF n=1 Tax=Obesumbacterium proteus TaxID=82983 RepID=UPI0006225530|nr:curli production assembly/transport protein CsgF [Obesumbacterium proteus]MDN6229365.1 curli production assembly/transport protein CsgF [Enterobacterales bacterium]KKI48573.1 curli assembly protein CsgF [Obesumbacterium proteus]MCE9885797.1 curli production assembly/transport protein CsgF [Obesumbacterium proteus]MCE9916372.1 curli production assembly/transport protein CsgF [Obesumbacterium proteus]MCE9929418.1 curli production assembly/transport protein CsgF [Obesumbacterium proteus]